MTALILLAAGASTRMGRPKQLLPYRGVPMVRRAAMVALASLCRPVIVVTGANAEAVGAALDGLPVTLVFNAEWEGGMGTSIGAGLRALPVEVDSAVLALADQPLITAEIYNSLLGEPGCDIVAARYAGTVGVPVLFRRRYFAELLALPASQGCKGVILAHREACRFVDCPEAEVDVDTPEGYRRVGEGLGGNAHIDARETLKVRVVENDDLWNPVDVH